MTKLSFTVQSYTFPSVSFESITLNDHGQVGSGGTAFTHLTSESVDISIL